MRVGGESSGQWNGPYKGTVVRIVREEDQKKERAVLKQRELEGTWHA